jgi:putative SOS response-associated peptidase YedK
VRAEQRDGRAARPHAVILAETDWPKWLGEEPANEEELLALLRPCRDEVLKIWRVDKMVPQLILPVLSNSVPA